MLYRTLHKFNNPLDTTHVCLYLLSMTDTMKYTTTNIKLMPQARWTDPLGSSLQDKNILSKICLAAAEGDDSLDGDDGDAAVATPPCCCFRITSSAA